MTKARDIASASPAPSTVSATELGYLDGVTSAVQTQIDGKQAINANVSTTELGYLDGVTSAIQTQLDAKTAKSTLTTTGDIYYASAANTPARLGIGSTGNVLTVASGIPSWAAPAGGGKVLQVVSTTYSTEKTITSTSYTDTDLSATITPTSATSKILIFVSQSYIRVRNATTAGSPARLLRGATSIFTQDGTNGLEMMYLEYVQANAGLGLYNNFNYLDSPSTTSSTTYKTQTRVNGAGSIIAQWGGATSVITLMEIGA